MNWLENNVVGILTIAADTVERVKVNNMIEECVHHVQDAEDLTRGAGDADAIKPAFGLMFPHLRHTF